MTYKSQLWSMEMRILHQDGMRKCRYDKKRYRQFFQASKSNKNID